MLKRIISVIVIIVVSLSFGTIIYAEDRQPVFYILGNEERYVGEQFGISYGMYNDAPLVDYFKLLLYYNPEVLEFVSATSCGAVGDQTRSSIGIYSNEDTLEKSNCLYISIYQNYEEWSMEGTYGRKSMGDALFNVIGEGDAGLRYEIISNECSNGQKVAVDFGDLDKMEVKEDTSEISLSYSEDVLAVSGKGLVIGSLKNYDVENILPDDYYKYVEKLVVDEGIRILRFSTSTWINLKELYLPKSLEEFLPGFDSKQNITIYSHGMSEWEKRASKYNTMSFVLNEGTLLGDIDLNGSLNAEDALRVLRMSAKIDDMYKWTADINMDSEVNASDALQILKIAAHLI